MRDMLAGTPAAPWITPSLAIPLEDFAVPVATPDTSDTLPALTQKRMVGTQVPPPGPLECCDSAELPPPSWHGRHLWNGIYSMPFFDVSTCFNIFEHENIYSIWICWNTSGIFFSTETKPWNLRFCRISIAVRMHCLGQCHAQRNLASEKPHKSFSAHKESQFPGKKMRQNMIRRWWSPWRQPFLAT